MAKRTLGATRPAAASRRLLSVRLEDQYLQRINISMARRGMGRKGRSEWFRMAFISLSKMAREDHVGFLSALALYSSTGGKGVQITLDGEGLKAFEALVTAAGRGPAEQSALITRLVLMATHLQLFDEGIAMSPAAKAR